MRRLAYLSGFRQMRVPLHLALAAVAAAILSAVAVAVALATPQDDFQAVYADWKPDGDVTACAFSQQQLQNALDVANGSPDFQYNSGFQDEVQVEIDRWKAGGCAGVSPVTKRRISPLNGARIMKVAGRGKAAKEYVKIKNRTRKTIRFRKATLRNKGRGRATFPAKFKLRARKTAVVRLGCAPHKRKAYAKGTKVWLCKRGQLFADRGDAARLADAKGIVVSQRGFGTQKRRVAY